MNGKENSIPLKNRMKMKCVKFRTRCEFVRVCSSGVVDWVISDDPFDEDFSREDGKVSGRYKYK